MIPPLVAVEGAEFPALPPGIHRCSVEELRAAFVDAFPSSASREWIFSGFLKLRETALRCGLRGFQWIDGSFAEGKLDPNDVDVVTVCTFDSVASAAAQDFAASVLANGERTKTIFQTDSFLLVELPEGHPKRDEFLEDMASWREFWGRTRSGVAKGFLQIDLHSEGEP